GVVQELAGAAAGLGPGAGGEELYRQSLGGSESLGEVQAQVRVLVAMQYNRDDHKDLSLLDRAEALARSIDDKKLLGAIAHNRSDAYFSVGDFASAITWLETAITEFEQAGGNDAPPA